MSQVMSRAEVSSVYEAERASRRTGFVAGVAPLVLPVASLQRVLMFTGGFAGVGVDQPLGERDRGEERLDAGRGAG